MATGSSRPSVNSSSQTSFMPVSSGASVRQNGVRVACVWVAAVITLASGGSVDITTSGKDTQTVALERDPQLAFTQPDA